MLKCSRGVDLVVGLLFFTNSHVVGDQPKSLIATPIAKSSRPQWKKRESPGGRGGTAARSAARWNVSALADDHRLGPQRADPIQELLDGGRREARGAMRHGEAHPQTIASVARYPSVL